MKTIKPPCGGHKSGIGNKYRCCSWACATVSGARRYVALEKDAIQSGILDGLTKTKHGYTNQNLG